MTDLDNIRKLKSEMETKIANFAMKLASEYGVYIDYVNVRYNTFHETGSREVKIFSDVTIKLEV